MKKLLLAVILCTSLAAFSQKDGEVGGGIVGVEDGIQPKNVVESGVRNAYIENEDKKQYNFYFKNMASENLDYVKFSFKGGSTETYDQLYNLLAKKFEGESITPVRIKTYGEQITFKYFNDNGERRLVINKLVDGKSDVVAASKAFTLDEIKTLFKK